MGQRLEDLFEDNLGQSLLSPELVEAVSKNKAHTVKLAVSKKAKGGSGGGGPLTLSFRHGERE